MCKYSIHSLSRTRGEGFSFNFGSLRVELCSRDVVFMFAAVHKRPFVSNKAVTVGEVFGGFGWKEA